MYIADLIRVSSFFVLIRWLHFSVVKLCSNFSFLLDFFYVWYNFFGVTYVMESPKSHKLGFSCLPSIFLYELGFFLYEQDTTLIT
jgi:hypothetical protein